VATLRPAVHRAILIIDVEGFGDPARTNAHQVAVRDTMYKALQRSFARARISWADCVKEDRGDGALVLIPSAVPKSKLVTGLPTYLAEALARHNARCPEQQRIRLRMALHAGEVHQDAHGYAGASINLAFRLIEAPVTKMALRDSSAALALIVSEWFYDEVVRHHPATEPSSFCPAHVVVKETETTAWFRVLGPAGPRLGAGAASTAPARTALSHPPQAVWSRSASSSGVRHSLPPDAPAFTGREEELNVISASVTQAAGPGRVVAIHAIDGMPGVGKTTLAVHAAHLMRDRFPDRQLFINLGAHTPGQDPLTAEAALAGLLTAVGVDARNLPGDLQGRASLWRDRMAGQRALLVLDNAASSDQVAPLLPGDGGCLVLVTSRRHLGDLPGAARPVMLQVLPPGKAQEMFVRLAPRAAADPDAAVAELMRLAGFLPLAISLLARVYARHPSWTLADLAAETRASMLTLAAEKNSVAAAFEVSYRYLDPGLQEFFRRLGLHPGTTIDGYAAAALTGTAMREASTYLGALHGEGLLTEAGYRRYRMHDLIRRYASERAAADPAPRREQALNRLLDYYQHTAALAEARLAFRARSSPAPDTATPPTAIPALTDSDQTLAWARTERSNLLACLDYATSRSLHARIVTLTASLATLLRQDGPWADALTRHAAAVEAARQLGDRPGQANALLDLGTVRWLIGDYPSAATALEEALGIFRDLGDRLGQANALTDLGVVRWRAADYPGAAAALEEALGIFRDLGDRLGQANALLDLGTVRWLTGDYPGAAAAEQDALDISRDLRDRRGEAEALNRMGTVRWLSGDYPGAAAAVQEALSICRDLRDRRGEADALNVLGVVQWLSGDYPAAATAQEEALSIFLDIGDRRGEADALNRLGSVRRLTGDYPGAAAAHEEALGIYRAIGDRGSEIEALDELGTLCRVRGDIGRAEAYYRRALDLAHEITGPWYEAEALAGLGRCALAAGRTADAVAGLLQAREIFEQIGAVEATAVAAELDRLAGAEPASSPRPRGGGC
jgi:tetratricopeptide (TPR) repeat protein